MNKIDSLYQELLKKEVVTSDDIKEVASKILGNKSFQYIYDEYLKKLKETGKLLHPRKGLYIAVPPVKIDDNSFQPDRYLLASKIQEPYYLGYHTALEIHGSAYSSYNIIYIVVLESNKFRGFEFKGIEYRPIYSSYFKKGIKNIQHKGQNISVSSPSRTFIDCIDRPRYAGGWEECLKSLESLTGVSSDDLKNILDSFDKDILYRKTGLILEIFQNDPYYEGILEEIRPYLKENIGSSPMYLSEGSKSELNKDWKLYVPYGFQELLRGV